MVEVDANENIKDSTEESQTQKDTLDIPKIAMSESEISDEDDGGG